MFSIVDLHPYTDLSSAVPPSAGWFPEAVDFHTYLATLTTERRDVVDVSVDIQTLAKSPVPEAYASLKAIQILLFSFSLR